MTRIIPTGRSVPGAERVRSFPFAIFAIHGSLDFGGVQSTHVLTDEEMLTDFARVATADAATHVVMATDPHAALREFLAAKPAGDPCSHSAGFLAWGDTWRSARFLAVLAVEQIHTFETFRPRKVYTFRDVTLKNGRPLRALSFSF
jgi:hypothetical protein